MTIAAPITARVILLDIEGTTTPVDFVYDVLFPFARKGAGEFLARGWSRADIQSIVADLRRENERDAESGLLPPRLAPDADADSVAAYIHWLMDRDRKSTPLKTLQGLIWEAGYQSGELRSRIFLDVPPALQRWRRQGRDICIYSSGSVLAQRLLFSHTEAGDLTVYIRDYFDTNIGAKREAESYRRIADALGVAPGEILFVSDVTPELDAAKQSGLETRLCVRAGNAPQPRAEHLAIDSFDEIP